MKGTKYWFLVTLIALFTTLTLGQKENQPQAKLRLNKNCTTPTKCFAIDIYMPASLESGSLAKLTQNEPDKPRIAFLFNGTTHLQFEVGLSAKDIVLRQDRQGRVFEMLLPSDFPLEKTMQLIFEPFNSSNGEKLFPSAAVGTDFATSFEFDSYNRSFRQKVVMDSDPISCAASDSDCKDDLDRLKTNHLTYVFGRLLALQNWFENVDKDTIELKIEDLTKCLVIEDKTAVNNKRGCITYNELREKVAGLKKPTDFPNPSEFQKYFIKEAENFRTQNSLTIKDIKPSKVEKVIVGVKDENLLVANRSIVAYLQTENKLPPKFNVQLKFTSSDVPLEVAKTYKKTSLEIAQISTNPSEDTGKVGDRVISNRLDVALQIGSSVGIKEETENGLAVKNIKRTTLATIDLRINPFDTVPVLGDSSSIQWLPFFIDAKVSNGSITKDNISVNRVVFGTQFDFTKYLRFKDDVATNPNYLNLTIRGVNASDRDFKQLEYKGVAEFQPRIAFLNRIPANFKSSVNKILIAEGDKIPFREIEPSFGFKIQPLVGGEIGKTWFRRRPVDAVKPTEFIRRVYAGIDLTLYFPQNISISFSDKFFWGFGKGVDSRENHFKTTLDFGLRKTREFGDSMFITFEKGNLPPFGTRDVNAFKIGYRFVNPNYLNLW